jgi:thiamine-phosphate pyrophosphorylase
LNRAAPGAPPGRRPAPRLYIVTDRRATGGRPLDAVLALALAGAAEAGVSPGTVAVQLREKDLEGRALLELAHPLRRLTGRFGAALYINDRVDVALAAAADGVHLAGTSMTPAEVAVIAPEMAVAVSVHGVAELARAAGAPTVAFAVLGPIFATPSKERFGPPLGLGMLAAVAKQPLPVLALGGVTVENSRACLAAGARGIACITAVLAAPDPKKIAFSFCREILRDAAPP